MKRIRLLKLLIGSFFLTMTGTAMQSCRTSCYVPSAVDSNNVRYLGSESVRTGTVNDSISEEVADPDSVMKDDFNPVN